MVIIFATLSYILNIDTSDSYLYVAISKAENCIAEMLCQEPMQHAAKLQLYVAQVLQIANITFADVAAIAVLNGPGSYTGLRVGLSAAKGYCFALNIPLITVSKLAAYAYQYWQMEPAHSKAVVNCFFLPMAGEIIIESYTQPLNIIKKAELYSLNLLKNNIYQEDEVYIGEGSASLSVEYSFFLYKEILYKRTVLAQIAYQKLITNSFENLVNADPYYLKSVYITQKKVR